MKESSLWAYLKRGMAGRWDACRHEDVSTLGVPDVSFGINHFHADGRVNGWIELKSLDAWPKRPSTTVRIGLSAHQFRWLRRRGHQGGNCWVFLRVGREYLLFGRSQFAKLQGSTAEGLRDVATGRWRGSIDFDDLARILARGC